MIPPAAPPLKQKSGILGTILVSLLILILLAATGGAGYWVYTLNNNLTAKNSQVTALQGKYEKLQGAHEQLISDLDQAKADLETASGDLTKAQDNLKQAKDKSQVVENRVANTLTLLDVASALYDDSIEIAELEEKIGETGDAKLSELWDKYKDSGRQEDLESFLFYLFRVITENLNKKAN